MKDEYVLIGVPKTVELKDSTGETHEISGKRFSDLHVDIQNALNSYIITARVMELEDDEDAESIVDEIFYRLNNGTQVSKEHLTLISTNRSIQDFVRRIVKDHPLFTTVAHYTEAQLRKSDKEMTVLQTIVVLSGLEFKSFSAKHIEDFFRENKNISSKVLDAVEICFDEIALAFGNEYNKFVQKTHIPMLSSIAALINFDKFAVNYSEITNKNDEYRRFCGAGCTKKDNVLKRLEGIKNLYNEFIKG
jgi:hypothetical protein